jgi:hypothetical protein
LRRLDLDAGGIKILRAAKDCANIDVGSLSRHCTAQEDVMKRTIVIAAALAAANALSAPAMAHPRPFAHSHGPGHHTPIRADIIRDDINRLDGDIDRADRNDTISEREAADLRSRLRGLREQFHRFNRNGLSVAEMNTLKGRANYIRDRLRLERFDWDRHAG